MTEQNGMSTIVYPGPENDPAKTALRSLPTGDLRLTACSFSHTCNLPSIPSPQPAGSIILTAHPPQRAGHGTYTGLGTE
jgi:hypothetical protein